MEALSSFTQAFSHEFTSPVRSKARAYESRNLVHIIEQNDSMIAAIVSGTDDYDVLLFQPASDNCEVDVSCTCPHFESGDLCKHIWATLRRCDALDMGFPALNYDEAYIEPYLFEHLEKIISKRSVASFNVSKVQPPSNDWQTLLQIVEREVPSKTVSSIRANDKGYEVYYVVNIADCITNGNLTVQLMERRLKDSADYSSLTPFAKTLLHLDNTGSSLDVQLVQMLTASSTLSMSVNDRYYQMFRPINKIQIVSGMNLNVMSSLCESGRCLWRLSSEQSITTAKPLSFDYGEPYRFLMKGVADDESQSWKLTGHLQRGDTLKDLAHDIVLGYANLVMFNDGTMAKASTAADYNWVNLFAKHGQISIPFADRDTFLQKIYLSGHLPNLQFPKELQPNIQTLTPIPRLYLKTEEYNFRLLTAEAKFVYGDVECAHDDQALPYLPETQSLCHRDLDLEDCFIRQLDLLDFTSNWGPQGPVLKLNRAKFTEVVEELLNQGWEVNAEGCQMKTSINRSINVSSGIDWFDLEAEFDFDGEAVELPALLKAVRKGEQWIELGNGARGLLPTEWLAKYGQTLELGEAKDGAVRFRPSQAMMIDSILASQPNVSIDKKFKDLRKQLARISGVKPKKEPNTFKGELRDYQRDGLGWINFLKDLHFGGCLADDMGLGKTVQILAMLEERRKRRLKKEEVRKPSLVIVPKSLVFNWCEEAARFSPKLSVIAYHGRERTGFQQQLHDSNIVVTTYGTMRKDIEYLSQVDFDYVILDEAQAIKNASSLAAKACRTLKADHRLAATGTPIENNLNELWSLFEFLNPGMLGRSAMFKSAIKDAAQNPESLQRLSKAVAPYVLRRTKEQVLEELPDKTEQILHCELSTKHRKEYDQLRKHYQVQLDSTIAEKGLQNSKIHVLEALLRLRQAACHPGLIDKKRCTEPSAKVDLLMEQLAEVVSGGHKALVFSQFTSFLSIIKTRMDKAKMNYEYLDGKTSNRQARVNRFQTDESCSTFLISLKAGGTGLNLTAADYVFILDPWWNPAAEAQAVDRAHRIGQDKKVTAYRIITKDTIEEKVSELQVKKKNLADAIISTNDHLLKSMSFEDLQMLLSD